MHLSWRLQLFTITQSERIPYESQLHCITIHIRIFWQISYLSRSVQWITCKSLSWSLNQVLWISRAEAWIENKTAMILRDSRRGHEFCAIANWVFLKIPSWIKLKKDQKSEKFHGHSRLQCKNARKAGWRKVLFNQLVAFFLLVDGEGKLASRKRRYFVLDYNEHRLNYYVNEEEKKLCGFIDLDKGNRISGYFTT